MRILVVGGTGFIGAHVVERLATEHDVTVLHRGKIGVGLGVKRQKSPPGERKGRIGLELLPQLRGKKRAKSIN